MLTAITRAVSPTIGNCELTFLERQPIDVEKAAQQHRAYEECLTELGVRVISLAAEPELPDSVFVEDTAVVVNELAVMTRPGAASRRPEVESIAAVLSKYRPLEFITPPATLEGGDVLRVERTLFVGASGRTNREGIRQLQDILEPYGYEVRTVNLNGCLHCKSACSYLGRNTIVANRAWVQDSPFESFEVIDVAPTEPSAANALAIGDVVLLPNSFPETRARLEAHGFHVETLDVSELQKAEAGLTCSSVIFESEI
jgi:dimethylargininase